MKLWLDDVRPAPAGWTWVKTVDEARDAVLAGGVDEMSLDHDLGACAACLKGRSADEWLEENDYQSMPNCDHFGTGYQFVCWMEESGKWPVKKPKVHSRNPAGRAKMEAAILKQYGGY